MGNPLQNVPLEDQFPYPLRWYRVRPSDTAGAGYVSDDGADEGLVGTVLRLEGQAREPVRWEDAEGVVNPVGGGQSGMVVERGEQVWGTFRRLLATGTDTSAGVKWYVGVPQGTT